MTHVFGQQDVSVRLTAPLCAEWLAKAMIALSTTARDQPLRNIIPMGPDKLFALMPGALPVFGLVGAKVITAYPEAGGSRRSKHRGMVLGFDSESGELLGMADAHEVTLIRTAVASAIATNCLARRSAGRLAIMGTGAQAYSHAKVFAQLRDLERITLWGRDTDSADILAAKLEVELSIPVRSCASPETAVGEADIIVTVTGAAEPILLGEWVQPGTHVNLVGSSHAGPREADVALVTRARYFTDCRPYALVAAAEFIEAKRIGSVSDEHVLAEIGEVLAGLQPGRQDQDEVTIYKSLGHVVQDLAALACLLATVKIHADA